MPEKGKKQKTSGPHNYHQLETLLYEADGWDYDKIRAELEKRTTVKKYVIAKHDQDISEDGTPKQTHFHVFMNYGDASWNYEQVAKWFHVAPEKVQKINSDPNGVTSKRGMYFCTRYYMHMDQPEKHYYPASGFLSNVDIEQFLAQEIAKDKNRTNGNRENSLLHDLLIQCSTGEIMPYNYEKFIPGELYALHAQKFKNAWKFYHETLVHNANGHRNAQILWFYGPPGTYKSTMGLLFAEELNLPVCVTEPGKDPLNHYADQPIILLEDIKPENWNYEALLSFLSPHQHRGVASRFENKIPFADYIIVTSTFSPPAFYEAAPPACPGIDSAAQLYRRINQIWRFSPDTIEISRYDLSSDRFIAMGTRENPAKGYVDELSASQPERADPLDVLSKISDKYAPAKRQMSLFAPDGAKNSA